MADNRFTGKARALKRMAAIPNAIKAEVMDALNKNAIELREAMKRAAPEDDGDLIDSIQSKDISSEGRIAVQVAAGDDKAFYAKMVEFGTPLQQSQPFFFPTYRALKKRLLGRITRAMRKGARRAVGK